jgi:hypothetical protein
MITIFFSSGQGKKHYTVTSIDTLRKNLSEFHGIKIKRRWTFQCLRYLLDKKYIKRKGRYVHDNNGVITQIPSIVSFTIKGMAWLVARGVRKTRKIYKTMMEHLKGKDRRFPQKKDFDDGSWKPIDPEMRAGLKYMLGIATKKTEWNTSVHTGEKGG